MVAYSFKERFAEDIIALRKRQTIRANRKRHARPGERLQLFTGMRTAKCRKLLKDDPVCIDVVPIVIEVKDEGISGLRIDGWDYTYVESERFARADGFESLADMHSFWKAEHGIGRFEGVLISWRPWKP